MNFNENSRVKIPAILHLMRLGYTYIPLNKQNRREDTNIFEDIFIESLQRINPDILKEELSAKFSEQQTGETLSVIIKEGWDKKVLNRIAKVI